MNALEFISEVAWPFAVLVVALAYRPLIVSLLERNLTRFRAGPFEMAWEQAAEVIRRPAPLQTQSRPVTFDEISERGASSLTPPHIAELIDKDPRAAILATYLMVEKELRDALEQCEIEPPSGADALALVRTGESAGLFPSETTDAILGLQVLRNLTLHAPSQEHLEPSKAREYLALAEASLYSIASALRRAAQRDSAAISSV